MKKETKKKNESREFKIGKKEELNADKLLLGLLILGLSFKTYMKKKLNGKTLQRIQGEIFVKLNICTTHDKRW